MPLQGFVTAYHFQRCLIQLVIARRFPAGCPPRSPQSPDDIAARAKAGREVSDARGYDAGKKINGRQRHILGDPIGLLLAVMGLPADLQDREGAKRLLTVFFGQKTRRRAKRIWADGGYAGALLAWSRKRWRCTIKIVKRSAPHPFKGLPRRWVVERTFGWLGRYQRLRRDYKRPARTDETMAYLAMIRLRLARLGRP